MISITNTQRGECTPLIEEMRMELYLAWAGAIIGYVAIIMPLIGSLVQSGEFDYLYDMKVGAAIHIGLALIFGILSLLVGFLWCVNYLISYYI